MEQNQVGKNSLKSIFIAIPNMGNIVTGLARNLIVWSHNPKYRIKIYMPSNMFPLDNARNRIVKEFLEQDYDYIWWIDCDIVPEIETLDRLIQADKDIIGAACFSTKFENGEWFVYPVTLRFNEEKRYIVYYGKGIEEVDALGGACLLIRREVYEKITRPYEFQYHKDGTLSLTCDFKIFDFVRELGYKIYVDFDILCSHMKTVDLRAVNNLLVKNEKV